MMTIATGSGSPRANDGASSGSPALIEIGWLEFDPLDAVDRQALAEAREQLLSLLRDRFPQFQWKTPVVRREQAGADSRVEPAALLDMGVTERDLRRWDFTVIVTPADLFSYYRGDAVAAVSRSLEGMVISTLRLDPRISESDVSDERRIAVMARRLRTLVLHALGHHAGLPHVDDPRNFMSSPELIEDLDGAELFTPQQEQQLARELGEVADRRLEEMPTGRRSAPLVFYLRSAWLNRREIVSAIWEARPWEIPYRLSGLTTAAVSAMLVLIMSAEAWDLATDQPALLVVALSILSVGATTVFLLLRQRLLLRRGRTPLGEQTVTTNIATVAIVLLGIVTSYAVVFLLGVCCGLLFFTPSLLDNWTGGSASGGVTAYLKPAGFAAGLAMLIGALGATFDRNRYFRHITAVDEEI